MRSFRSTVRQVKGVVVLATLLGSALSGCDRPEWTIGTGGAFSSGGSIAGGGKGPTLPPSGSGGGGAPGTPCYLDRVQGPTAIFEEQTVDPRFPASRELYALVTDEEAEALRAGTVLVPAPSQLPMKPAVVQLLESLMVTAEQQPLVQSLASRLQISRSTWPNPWALRLVDYPATQHVNPVRILLREQAWVARIVDGKLAVLDLNNELVSTGDALAEPERIAAVFFPTYQGASAPSVGGCNTGFRTFALGATEMVEEWSLATDDIVARLEQDLTLLRQLLVVVRNCSAVSPGTSFNTETACNAWASSTIYSEYTAYQAALSHPVELYKPSSQHLITLIEALEGDLFEPDPFSSAPGGEGGAAGDSGSASAGEGGVASGGAFGAAGVGGN
ncbi:MAG TPA: hypothetical protein VIW29_03465 [Polyangiaceae bacterium]